MEHVFIELLNMSITASWLVLAIILFRLLFKKAPKALHVGLWALVGIRLICPFSIESVLSLVPSTETIPQDIVYSDAPTIESGIPALNSTVNPIISETLKPEVGASVNPVQIWLFAASNIWVIGIIVMFLYTAISYWRIHRKVRESVRIQENIWMCDRIDTPFILGVFRPHIYLPSNMCEQDIKFVLAHEQAHIKRHDHWWKPLGFALLSIYWFHPILWIAYILLCRDIELACDEKVIKEMGIEIKKPYSDALINCSISRKAITACPLAFGEVGVKERVKTVLNYKKPAFWIVLIAVIACVIVAVCFLTNPKDKQDKEAGDRVTVSSSIYAGVHLPETILSQDDAKTIINILDSRAWEEDTNPEMGTFIIVINEKHYEYEPAEGILHNHAQKECLVLSEEDKATVGEIIDKYLFADTTKSNITKWFDYYRSDEFDWYETLEIELPEFPEIKFQWKEGEVSVIDAKGTTELIGGMAVACWNGYFCDLTKDGIPELCATVSVGSGMIDTRIVVYDCVTGDMYQLEDRSFYDYTLFLVDEELIVNKTKYMTEYIVEQGGLAIKGTSKEAELVLVPTQSFKESFVLKSGAYLAGAEYVPPTSSSIGLYPYFYLNTDRKEFHMGQSPIMSFALF